jgi:hypothetical protein
MASAAAHAGGALLPARRSLEESLQHSWRRSGGAAAAESAERGDDEVAEEADDDTVVLQVGCTNLCSATHSHSVLPSATPGSRVTHGLPWSVWSSELAAPAVDECCGSLTDVVVI